MSTPSFPVNLNLSGKPCLVIGKGEDLALRACALLDAGAEVVVVCEAPSEAVRKLALSGRLKIAERSFDDADLEGMWLCVLVGASPEQALRVGEAAEHARVFFCAVDAPGKNTFSHMAQARSGALSIAIATAGEAPALARRLREELQRLLDESGMQAFVERISELRRHTPSAERKRVLGEAVAAVHFTGKLHVPE